MKFSHAFGALLLLSTTAFSTNLLAETKALSDSEITTTLKSNIAKHHELPKYQIDILTNDGIVVLTGEVANEKDAAIFIEEAQALPGVKDVNLEKFKVKHSTHAFADTVITAKVKGKFLEQELFGSKKVEAMSIHVSTKGGTVLLTGKADNKQQAETAVELAKAISGVKNVESKIIVK